MRSFIVFVMSLFLGIGCVSQKPAMAANVFSAELSIVQIQAWGGNQITFVFQSNILPGCQNDRMASLSVGSNGVTEAGMDRVYSLLLTASVTKEPVVIYYDDSTAWCWIGMAHSVNQ